MSSANDHLPVQIQLSLCDRALAARCHGWLTEAGFDIADIPAAGTIPGVETVAAEVIVVDRWPPDTGGQETAPAGVASSAEILPGIVYVGPGLVEAPDACLPLDCSARELALACRLVAKIARQRRRLRRASEDHHRLSAAALTDPLTGLPNRRAWDERLPGLLSARGNGESACLGLIDIDLFKAVNDRHGHAAGDRALRLAAAALRANLRHSDFLARLGGDEFAVLLSDISPAVAAVVVERARAAVHAALQQQGLAGVTASAGVVVCPPDDDQVTPSAGPQQMFESADRGLLRAKQSGRNRMVVEVLSPNCS